MPVSNSSWSVTSKPTPHQFMPNGSQFALISGFHLAHQCLRPGGGCSGTTPSRHGRRCLRPGGGDAAHQCSEITIRPSGRPELARKRAPDWGKPDPSGDHREPDPSLPGVCQGERGAESRRSDQRGGDELIVDGFKIFAWLTLICW